MAGFSDPTPFQKPSLIQKRGTTAQHGIYTGPLGELTVDTDRKTVVVQDGVSAGGHPLEVAGTEHVRTSYVLLRAAMTQNGTAALGFSSGSQNNSPTPISIQGNNTILGAAVFAPLVIQTVQDHFLLPPDWVPPLDLEILWRTESLTGNVGWQVAVAGMDYQHQLDPPFNPSSTLSCMVGSTPYELILNTITNIDCTNITPGTELFFRFSRIDVDTCMAGAELISLRWVVQRLYA